MKTKKGYLQVGMQLILLSETDIVRTSDAGETGTTSNSHHSGNVSKDDIFGKT